MYNDILKLVETVETKKPFKYNCMALCNYANYEMPLHLLFNNNKYIASSKLKDKKTTIKTKLKIEIIDSNQINTAIQYDQNTYAIYKFHSKSHNT